MSQGFLYTKDSQGNMSLVLANTLPFHIPGQSITLMDALAQSDIQFQHCWYCWYTQAYNLQALPTFWLKHQKLGKAKKPANFFCSLNMLEAIKLLLAQKAVITTILHRLPTKAGFLLISDSNSTLSYTCFKSCFPPPHNHCNMEDCCHTKSNPPVAGLYVDLSVA
jgi:hypothetical protein